jgi:outer membrane protein, heavy metal efflux system
VKLCSLGGLLCLLCHAIALSQSGERLSLNEAIAIAVEHNPEVRSAGQAVDAARGRFWKGISPPPAQLTAGYDYVPTGYSLNEYGERYVGVSQSFEFPTTTLLRGSSLSSEIDVAMAEFKSATLAITTRVKLAYYGVLARERKLMLAEENLSIAEEFAHKAGVRYSVGEGTNLEHLTANVQRTQAMNAVELARNELRLARSELTFILGTRAERSEREYLLTDSLVFRPYNLNVDSLIELAQHSNPRIHSGSFRLDAASVNRSIAWSSILPSFTISYSRQVQGANSNLYGVGFGISLPIWFLFDQRGQIQEASAVVRQIESDLTSTRNVVTLEVKNASLEYENDEHQVRLYRAELLPQADEVYRSAAASYQAGEITYLEFLQARQTLVSIRTAYIDALYHYNAAITQLEKAVGQPIHE